MGLGKTIEAGLAFRGLWLAGRVRSIRIFAPASLTSQWLHEMAEKFFMPFQRRLDRQGTSERADPATGAVERFQQELFSTSLEIISTGLLSRGDGVRLLEGLPETDFALVDEAHKARRRNPNLNRQEASFNHLYRALERGISPPFQVAAACHGHADAAQPGRGLRLAALHADSRRGAPER
ncbi:MAG: hypothetical protein ACLFSI_01315 [Halorhodospira sp.]